MRRDRLLRPHQRPWLHQAVYASPRERVAAAQHTLEERAADRSFAECLLTFGGDLGFHLECRFVRTHLGDWTYELDCQELPLQSVAITDAELQPVYSLVRDRHAGEPAHKNGMMSGGDSAGRLPVLWYHSARHRLVWIHHDEPLQESLIALLKSIHRRLDLPFPSI